MARKKYGLLADPRTVPVSRQSSPFPTGVWCRISRIQLTQATERSANALHMQCRLMLLCEWLAGSLYDVAKKPFVFSHVE